MGIYSESILAKSTVFEAEMRRRLWWSLTLFDSRVSETAFSRSSSLDPTWNCRAPLNVNDSDLRPEMKELPKIQSKVTESSFAVVRCELGDFARYSEFYLDFSNPALKPIARLHFEIATTDSTELQKLEKRIEDQYLQHCDQDNPIHFMTIWSTRTFIAKFRLLEHHSRFSDSSVRTEEQHEVATAHALKVLECDTKIMSSPLTTRFRWSNQFYFPFPAYIQILQDLRRRPHRHQTRHAWEVISDNYGAWAEFRNRVDTPVMSMFFKVILGAWQACEAAFRQSGHALPVPRIVVFIKTILGETAESAWPTWIPERNVPTSMGVDTSLPMGPMDLTDQSLPFGVEPEADNALAGPQIYSGILDQAPLDNHMGHLDWSMDDMWPGWEIC